MAALSEAELNEMRQDKAGRAGRGIWVNFATARKIGSLGFARDSQMGGLSFMVILQAGLRRSGIC